MKKILLVEDTEINRDLIVQLLEDQYEIIPAENGEVALRLAEEERPDLVLMDLSLPVMDGWEATRRLKAQDELRHIPVIAVSAHAADGDERKALDAKCDAYISKPIDEDVLFKLLTKYLGA